MTVQRTLSTLEAYARWAPNYPPLPHNPLMRAEQRAMQEYWPEAAGRRALDLACGTGRYARLLAASKAEVFAVDFCQQMLRQVSVGARVRASMMSLPFASHTFDVVVCGLGVGHATAIDAWMAEISRVLAPGGVLLYSDFHPAAVRAGQTRSFRDRRGRAFTVPHRCHDIAGQRAAAEAASLAIEVVREIRAGLDLKESFSGSDEFYRRYYGLPVVLVVRARKR